jgi:hypothetical protein
MATKARDAIGQQDMTAVADRGYFRGEELRACEQQGITTQISKPNTSGSKAAGRFDKRDFAYNVERDEYICPAGQRAIRRLDSIEHGQKIQKYWSLACPRCPIRSQCTTSKYRRIARWEHEDVVERAEARLSRAPHVSRLRRQTVEHPFGTLKVWMGSTHFLMKTLPNVRTEMSSHVLAYNLKRMLNLFGTQPLIQAMRA